MPFNPVSLRTLRPGNRRGPTKVGLALREAILQAAAEHGEDDNGTGGLVGYLRKIAREDVRAMAALLGRVLPAQAADAGTGPVIEVIERRIVTIEHTGD